MTKRQFLERPLKSQVEAHKTLGGRNNKGRITSWHRGGYHKRLYRKIDFKRKYTQGIVIGLEYDPNRSAHLARIFNPDTKKQNYILATTNLQKGDVVRSNSTHYGLNNAHSRSLDRILTGTPIHNISLYPGENGQLLRASGSYGRVLKKTKKLAQIRLKSGQYRWFDIKAQATNGIIGNTEHRFIKLKKAGRARWLGHRPVVRGVAMNPIDHPHGGGEGKTSGGRPSVTPWGKPTKGARTRRLKKNVKI
uniref:Ribosomal protein L2 n=2 Tax=Sargassum TaxID=3015 RepID=A0A8K1YNW1_9PHAE|nr:ribosomal protein L2 [Sargassum muticum]YP_010381314.1 ribosomal protein L2 [Sargassum kjellmanianum]UVW81848.1 ribosomal protein L2 [Sargassum siliquastrum]AIE46232.1 ribosomal protein L2 [Sargassum muticum]UDH59699.1 ribosomal protein L2 [Sargassum kjellmanianum]UQV81232.1 ribosomal protein L2 [Sargassum muticum]